MADPQDKRDGLEAFWEDVRGGPVPDPVPNVDRHPGELVIGTNYRVLVRIQPDGQLRYGEGYTPDEAAEVFWTSLALKRKGMEERLMHLGAMEALLLRVGHADIATEQARLRAAHEDATAHDRFMAEISIRNLEAHVHQLIEFARGLVARPDAPEPGEQPDIPPIIAEET